MSSWLYLYDPHVEPRLLGQLLPDVARWLRRRRERRLQRLQLLGLDGGARAAPLPRHALLLVLVVPALLVRQRARLRLLTVLLGVLGVLRVLRVRGQARVAARRYWPRKTTGVLFKRLQYIYIQYRTYVVH